MGAEREAIYLSLVRYMRVYFLYRLIMGNGIYCSKGAFPVERLPFGYGASNSFESTISNRGRCNLCNCTFMHVTSESVLTQRKSLIDCESKSYHFKNMLWNFAESLKLNFDNRKIQKVKSRNTSGDQDEIRKKAICKFHLTVKKSRCTLIQCSFMRLFDWLRGKVLSKL